MKKYLWVTYLGISMSIIGYDLMDWQYYFVVIPTIMLAVWGLDDYNNIEEEE